MRPPQILETERLRLRPPTMEDADWIFDDYAQDPEVTKYMEWRPHESIQTTRDFLQTRLAGWEDGTDLSWVLEAKPNSRGLGMIGLRLRGHRADFGYVLARKHWGNGYATEASRAVVNWAIAEPQIYRVWAVCDVENRASARVLEKAGLTLEGTLKRWMGDPNISDEPRDVLCYSLVK